MSDSASDQQSVSKLKPSFKKQALQYFYLFLGFIIISLGLGFFRGSDHGSVPSLANVNLIGSYSGKNGEEFIIAGQPSIYYFWATWCSACKANDPFLKVSLSPLSEKSINFLSFEEGNNTEQELNSYLSEKNIEYPVAMGSPELLRNFQVQAYPTTIFADDSGKIRFVDTGIMNPFSFWLRVYLLKLF
jgi:thiol-disulfide isomerase/thioredoxin